jgi:hypothetical protein
MKKPPQMDFYQSLSREVIPNRARLEPQVWFRHIAILRKLETGIKHEVRRIPLHRGLNILWAPPEDPEAEVRMYEDGISGHASGKTLFCRLLRYLLGEDNYGNEVMEKAVAKKFTELWVLGEVMVAGHLWLAARPLTESLHKFAVKGVTIDDYLRNKPAREDFANYLAAVEEASCGSLAGREEANELFRWRYLLPWLARDQESRFAGLTEWRSSLSEAKGPQTSFAEQQLLIRAVVDLLEPKEQRLKSQLETVEGVLETDNESLPVAEREWRRDWKHLSGQLKRISMEAEEPQKERTIDALEMRVTKFKEGVEEAIRLANEDPELKATQSDWQKKRDEKIASREQIRLLTKDVTDLESKWKEISSKRQKLREQGIKNPARLEDGLCPNTLAEAIKRGCVKLPPGASIETELELGNIQAESDVLKGMVDGKKSELARVQSGVERLEAVINGAWAKYQTEQKRVDRGTAGLRRKEQDAEAALDRFEEIRESFETFTTLSGRISSNAKFRETLKQQLDAKRKTHTPREKYLSDLFADVVRAVMGSQVTAQTILNDRGISLKADRNGDLQGAALETIKVIAFDIAVLTASLEGKSHHPRFLIHDGPREADMSRVIYERYFLYARKLEESFASGFEPSFQYIVTTTTPPPKDMQFGSKWLLDPVLDASKKEGKLLREDL